MLGKNITSAFEARCDFPKSHQVPRFSRISRISCENEQNSREREFYSSRPGLLWLRLGCGLSRLATVCARYRRYHSPFSETNMRLVGLHSDDFLGAARHTRFCTKIAKFVRKSRKSREPKITSKNRSALQSPSECGT